MIIPFTIPLQSDELLYSYIQRLAIANGVPHPLFERAYAITSAAIPPVLRHRPRRDSADDFSNLYDLTNQPGSLLQFYMSSTLFPGYVPLLSKPVLAGYVARWTIRNELTGIIPLHNALITRVRICPECVREDIHANGYCYLHRSHQMVDAVVCHKHGCQLLEHNEANRFDELSDRTQFRPINYSAGNVQYALFLHNLLHSGIQTSIEDILPVLQDADGKEAQQYTNLALNKIKPRKFAHSLFRVFQTVEALKEAVPERKLQLKERVVKEISGSCRMTQEFRDSFVELSCIHCGLTFVTTPYRILQGFRCPDCDSKLDQEKLLRRVINNAYDGAYTLSEIRRNKDIICSLVHKASGQTRVTNMRTFVTGEIRCESQRQITAEDIRKQILRVSNGTFDFVEFNNVRQPIIQHKLCGRRFAKRYDVFLRYPTCPKCAVDKNSHATRPEFLWIYMTVRNKHKLMGEKRYQGLQKPVRFGKNAALEPVLTTSPGLKSER